MLESVFSQVSEVDKYPETRQSNGLGEMQVRILSWLQRVVVRRKWRVAVMLT